MYSIELRKSGDPTPRRLRASPGRFTTGRNSADHAQRDMTGHDAGQGVTNSNADEPADARKVADILGDEDTAGFAAGYGDQDVVRECLRDARRLEPLLFHHGREHVAGAMPRGGLTA